MKPNHPRTPYLAISTGILILYCAVYLFAQQDPTPLQANLQDLEVGSDWLYGDLEAGKSLAKESGKPLFVLFR